MMMLEDAKLEELSKFPDRGTQTQGRCTVALKHFPLCFSDLPFSKLILKFSFTFQDKLLSTLDF